MTRSRKGFAIVVVVGFVSLIALLAVATLSLTTRLSQGSTLLLRDARLDGAASYGLTSVLIDWRARSLGSTGVGTSREFAVAVAGSAVSVSVSVTRLSREIFWAVAEARAIDGSIRRESIILRQRLPIADSVVAESSSNVTRLGTMDIDSIAGTADLTLQSGAAWFARSGVVHALGDLEVGGGGGEGILIVEGRLSILGPFDYYGLIIARGGIVASRNDATLTGSVRVSGGPPAMVGLTVNQSAKTVQNVMAKELTPRPVGGRPWAELY